MTTPNTYASLINGSGVAVAHGMLVRISASKTFTLAQADSPGHLVGFEGVNGSGTVGPGGPANIFTAGASIDVLMDTGLTPVAGNTVYVSAATAGRGTNVAPANVQVVGVIQNVAQYATTSIVVVSMTGSGGGGGAGAQGAQGATGVQGAQGATGAGSQGAQGATGVQGPNGAQGATGAGSQGAQGASGAQGANGAQGATGAGAQGATGSQGAQGHIGNTGAQGAAGAQGATGAGAQGATGAQGANGAQGATGAQGSGLPGGTGLVKVTGGAGGLGVPNVDYTSANWFTQQLAVIQTFAPTIDSMPFGIECSTVNQDITVNGASGTGNVASLQTESSGVIQFSSGGTANSTRVATNVSGIGLVFNCKTQPWALAGKCKINTTPDANTGMKILDMAASTVDHIFGVQGTTTAGGSNVNFTLWINGAGNTFGAVSQALILGSYFNIIMVFDGTILTGLINGVSVGTISDLSNFDTTAGHPRAFSQNGATNANQAFSLDKWACFTPAAV